MPFLNCYTCYHQQKPSMQIMIQTSLSKKNTSMDDIESKREPQTHTPEISEKQGQANLKNKNCHIQLVVEPTHLEKYESKWVYFPQGFGVKIKKYLKPSPRYIYIYKFNHFFLGITLLQRCHQTEDRFKNSEESRGKTTGPAWSLSWPSKPCAYCTAASEPCCQSKVAWALCSCGGSMTFLKQPHSFVKILSMNSSFRQLSCWIIATQASQPLKGTRY